MTVKKFSISLSKFIFEKMENHLKKVGYKASRSGLIEKVLREHLEKKFKERILVGDKK